MSKSQKSLMWDEDSDWHAKDMGVLVIKVRMTSGE